MAQLEVEVVEARNLKKKDSISENDPYVRVYLDDKNQMQRTITKQNSRNPQWNETLILNHFTGQDLLHIDIYDEDSLNDEKIGSLEIQLNDLYEKEYIDDWFDLVGSFGSQTNGQIHLVLRYQKLKI